MGEIQDGDFVFDRSGQPCRVLTASEIFLGHECFEVEFDDGEKIVADSGHRWLTFTDKERSSILRRSEEWKSKRRARQPSRSLGKRPDVGPRNSALRSSKKLIPIGEIRTTSEIFDTLTVRNGRQNNHSVPICNPLELPDIDLPIPPYTLGVWLGDGKSVAGKVYIHDSDFQILEKIREDGFEIGKVPSEDSKDCPSDWWSLGILGDKKIPPQYLRSSASQRLELLRGLMDTGGDCSEDGGSEFTSTTRNLSEGVRELAHSLGFKATINTNKSALYGKECKPRHRVKITTNTQIFNLKRKSDRQNETVRQTQRHRYIVSCRKVPSVPVRCIAIDSPSHLFLAGANMVPTHNTDLLIGLATTAHFKSIIFRREFEIVSKDVAQRALQATEGYRVGWNANTRIIALPGGRTVEFGAMKDIGDWEKFKGRAHDLKAYDEVTEFAELQVRATMGWNRTTRPNQRCRVVMTFNPPKAGTEGEWVVRFFGPWLDENHPNPARPGELRWYWTKDGVDTEVEDGEPFLDGGEMVQPLSRTFIPAQLKDNPHQDTPEYRAVLFSLPEPLQSQLRQGKFNVEATANPWQVVPTAWIKAAQARWNQRMSPESRAIPGYLYPMTVLSCLGVDIARGGTNKTVMARRYGNFIAELSKYPGTVTPTGHAAALLAAKLFAVDTHVFAGANINVDVIGYGAACVDVLKAEPPQGWGLSANGINVSQSSEYKDKSGKLKCYNLRSEVYWRMRDALDPEGTVHLALPPDSELAADLAAPTWSLSPGGVIVVEPKSKIQERLGRSPDCGDAVCLAVYEPTANWLMPGAVASPVVPQVMGLSPQTAYTQPLVGQPMGIRPEADPAVGSVTGLAGARTPQAQDNVGGEMPWGAGFGAAQSPQGSSNPNLGSIASGMRGMFGLNRDGRNRRR
jgi:hypothetical protein